MGWAGKVQAAWFRRNLAAFLWPLLPLSWLYGGLLAVRRAAYRSGVLAVRRLPVPVVIVGNLIVGGAGKTPAVLWLCAALREAGRTPGIVSRGYGGSAATGAATPTSDPAVVGDEPVLLAMRSGVPVFVGRRRGEAGDALLAAHPEVDVILCDDGLQHYALARDMEILVSDRRGFGNGQLLPAGPLREPVARLRGVDAHLLNSVDADAGAGTSATTDPAGTGESPMAFAMRLVPGPFYRLHDSAQERQAGEFAGRRLYAIAGIGHPERFFGTLRDLGLAFDARAFPDHHPYVGSDLSFAADGVLLMTEKDAIKCRSVLDRNREAWVLPVSARVEPDLAALVLEKIDGSQTA